MINKINEFTFNSIIDLQQACGGYEALLRGVSFNSIIDLQRNERGSIRYRLGSLISSFNSIIDLQSQ